MEHPFQGLSICSILQDQSIQGTRQMVSRRFHGFIIKLRGATEYCAGDSRWLLEAGQILFVPQGSSYQIRQVEPGYSYVVNFTCVQPPEEGLQKLRFPQGFDIVPLAEKIYNSWQKEGSYSALANLYTLLSKTVSQREEYISPREKQLFRGWE